MISAHTRHAVLDHTLPGGGVLRLDVESMPHAVARPIVRALSYALLTVPRDLRQLVVVYDSSDKENQAGFIARQEYRWGKLGICPGFLSNTADEQVVCILHEFAHYYGDHMDRVFSAAANRFITDESARGFVYDQVKHAHEILAEDIAQLHYRLIFENALPPVSLDRLTQLMALEPEAA